MGWDPFTQSTSNFNTLEHSSMTWRKRGIRKENKKSKVFDLSCALGAQKHKTFRLSSKRQDIKREKAENPRRDLREDICMSSCIEADQHF
jgi:hypothetical protein